MIDIQEFKNLLIKELKLEDISADEIPDDSKLFGENGLGLDSVDSIELVLIVEKHFKVKISDPKKYQSIFANVKSLYDYIKSQI